MTHKPVQGQHETGQWRFVRWQMGILAVLLVGATAHAEIQNDQIGFSPNHVFESANAGENVDVLSGNLSLTVPLGPRIKLTERFDYGLTLYYNSKIWEFDCDPYASSSVHCGGTLPTYQRYGLGFSLLPGRIYHHARDYSWVYRIQLEDGSEHFFCDDYPVGAPGCLVDYTVDTTHLHVTKLPPQGSTFMGWKCRVPQL